MVNLYAMSRAVVLAFVPAPGALVVGGAHKGEIAEDCGPVEALHCHGCPPLRGWRWGGVQLIVDLLLKLANEWIEAADGRRWWQRHAVAAAVRSGSVAA
jgi:hypothetical protein